MVSKELSKEIRSHKDLDKDAAPFWRPAVKFYEELSKGMVAQAHTLDVFACALEQSGLAEMKPAVQATGGLVVQTDTFRNPVFKDSLARVFAKPDESGFAGRVSCATLDVYCSRDIKLQVRAGVAALPRASNRSLALFLMLSCRARTGYAGLRRIGGQRVASSLEHGCGGGPHMPVALSCPRCVLDRMHLLRDHRRKGR